ncbi:purarive serine threonine protein kinase [Moniliophthora roreri]|uniref:Uncharacterized protein n=2 Tax=Moniliophthora roreri TaxID=221103 RepID=A0A0W0FGA4_MONRR|nr:purarive serine threonine protein kinase [Moniliophthora roreri]
MASVGLGSDAGLDFDWVDITHDDLPIKLDGPNPPSLTLDTSAVAAEARSIAESSTLTLRASPSDSAFIYHRPSHARSRSVLGNWKNTSRADLQRPQSLRNRLSKVFRLSKKSPEDTRSILDDFPAPPSHLPTPLSSATPTPVAYAWPSKKNTPDSSPSRLQSAKRVESPLAEQRLVSPTKSASRFKSLRKVFAPFTLRQQPKSDSKVAPQPVVEPVAKPRDIPVTIQSVGPDTSQDKALPEVPVESQQLNAPASSVVGSHKPSSYEFVDPQQFSLSPSPAFGSELFIAPSTRTSFTPSSPSWLSRNVVPQLEISTSITQESSIGSAEEVITPPESPPPLPIPPRIFIATCSPTNTPPLSPLEVTDCWLKHLDSASKSRHSLVSNLSRNSSATSIAELIFNNSSEIRRSDIKNQSPLPEALLLKQPTNPSTPTETSPPSSPPPINIGSSCFGLAIPSIYHDYSSSTFDSARGTHTAASSSTNTPAPGAPPQLSSNLLNLLSVICAEARISMASNTSPWGKQADVVDFGGEVDYGNMQWFKDPPPMRPQPPPQPQQVAAYNPEPIVVQHNENFVYALNAAPNVLYGRWKQYGQLGVLAWCSEFAELIDNLKELGVAGNMFLETRRKALEACRDILKLKLDIKMQIIVMYLSAQVQRLRRFLDPDTTYDDYPEPSFPLDPYARS